MGSYQVFLHLDLLLTLPRTGNARRQIMDFIQRLSDQPNTPGDFADRDREGRNRQIKIIGDYAVTYWPDHAVKAVMVVDIRLADR